MSVSQLNHVKQPIIGLLYVFTFLDWSLCLLYCVFMLEKSTPINLSNEKRAPGCVV